MKTNKIKSNESLSLIQLKRELESLKIELQVQRKVGHDDTEKIFYTRKEVSELLNISYVTVHDWCKKKILHPYKMGNKTFFKKSEIIERMLNSNRDFNS